MRIFVYEYLTAHAIGRSPNSPERSMYLEGRAMRDALLEDFGRLPGIEAFALPDESAPHDPARFAELCRTSAWTLLIAPAFEDCLTQLAESALRAGGRLLGSSPEAIRLTSDKFRLFEFWRCRGIPTPPTTDREPTGCEILPAVWKPRYGAGSTHTFLLSSAFDAVRAKASIAAEKFREPMILQEFVPGRAASIGFLCGPDGNVPLAPAWQLLSTDGRFSYRGGEMPLSGCLAQRAKRLGERAIEGIVGLRGFVGVDLVLGSSDDGSRDYAIEINPRPTTSYVGLRAVADFNVAEALLHIAAGRLPIALAWKEGRIQFQPNGFVKWL